MKPITLIICYCLSSLAMNAQDSTRRQPLDIELRYGMMFTYGSRFSDAEWNKLTPGYQNIDETDTSYHLRSNGSYTTSTTLLQLQALGGFSWKALNRHNITTLSGFSFGTGSEHYGSRFAEKITWFRADTLTSSVTGQEYYIDSVVTKNQLKVYDADFIDLGVSLMFQTNRAKRFSVLTGITLLAGMRYRGILVVQDGEEKGRQDAYSDSVSPYPYPYHSTSYAYSNALEKAPPPSSQVGGEIPIEVDFTIGKKPGFWNKCVVGVNLSVGYRYTMIEGMDAQHLWNLTSTLTLKYRVFG